MAYEKIGFSAGQILKAEDLNHIEEAIKKLMPALTGVSLEGFGNRYSEVFLNPQNYFLYGMQDSYSGSYYYNSLLSNDSCRVFTAIDPIDQGAKVEVYEDRFEFKRETKTNIDYFADLNFLDSFKDLSIYEQLFFFMQGCNLVFGIEEVNSIVLKFYYLSFDISEDLNILGKYFVNIPTNNPLLEQVEEGILPPPGDYFAILSSDGAVNFEPLSIDYTFYLDEINEDSISKAKAALNAGREVCLSLRNQPFIKYRAVSYEDGTVWFKVPRIEKVTGDGESHYVHVDHYLSFSMDGIMNEYYEADGQLILVN